MPSPNDSDDLARVLAWYRDMGVDDAVGDVALDWFGRIEARPIAPETSVAFTTEPSGSLTPPAALRTESANALAPAPVRSYSATPPEAAESRARELSRSAMSLVDLETSLRAFDGCGLKTTAKSTCMYRGAGQAPLAVIGEAPGQDEDLAGAPFVGPAGRLLDKMLAAIGCSEADTHITNVVYWRPPGNRSPTPHETTICRPFLERQVEFVQPRVILLLGGAAAKHVLGVQEGIMRVRGKWHDVEFGGHRARAIATLHPAYLLRTPASKRLAWRDLLAVSAALKGAPETHH